MMIYFTRYLRLVLFICSIGLTSLSFGVEFGDGSADFTHPYLSAWHPGYSAKLYGLNPETGVMGWRKYVVEGDSLLGEIRCLPVLFTNSAGSDYRFYIAQDTSGNIRYLKEGNTSFLPDPPIFLPASTSKGTTWDIMYFMGQHRFTIAYRDTYQENSFGFGPYSNSLYIRHYWDGALIGLIVAAPRFGFVHYDGADICERELSNLSVVEGTARDAWDQTPLQSVAVWLGRTPPRATTTNSQGFYRFIDLPEGNYQMESYKNPFHDYSSSVYVPLGATVVKNLELIPLSGVISGEVTDALSGLPVSFATIQLDGDSNLRYYTDASGFYRVENVRIGWRYVHAWGGSHNLDGKPVEVFAGEESALNFSLQPVYGAIEGTLRDSITHNPIEGGSAQIDYLTETRITTGADGNFRLENVSPGIHYLQAWAPGYLFYQRRISLDINETLSNDIDLVVETAMLPPETGFGFEEGPDSWKFVSIPEIFDAPTTTSANGHLGLSPNGSTNCYGYWESPFIAFDAWKTYRVRFTMTSDQENPEKVPTIRLRVNSGNNQTVGLLVINSTTDADSSPTVYPKTYDLVFSPPASASSSGFTISFDLVNIGIIDNAVAWVFLESVEIHEVDVIPASP